MRKVLLNNKIVELYDSIEELPIVNFQKFNRYMLIDAGIGSDINDVDSHITKVAKFIKSDKVKALQELQNMRQNMFMIINEISPKHLAFATLIHSINGKEITDLSDENLSAIIDSFRSVKRSKIIDLLDRFKKKINSELELYFPDNFTDHKEQEAYSKLKQRTLLVLEGIKENKDNAEKIESIDMSMLNLCCKPKSFSGKKSVEIKYDKQFENMCAIIAQKLSLDPKKLTTSQFYNYLEVINQQAEAELKQYKSKGYGRR